MTTKAVRDKSGLLPKQPTPVAIEQPPPPIVEQPTTIIEHPLAEVVLRTPIPPESESSGTSSDDDKSNNVQMGKLIKTKTLTRVFHKYDKIAPNDELTEIKLTKKNDSSDNDSSDELKPTKSKHKKKRKLIDDDDDITETITSVSKTINDTVGLLGKNVVVELLKQMVTSKQFRIILIIVTIFGGIGWCLNIVVRR